MAAPTISKLSPIFVTFQGHSASRITKLKVKNGHRVASGTLVALYDIVNGTKNLRLKCNDVGTVHQILVKEGDLVNAGDKILELSGCDHPVVMKDMCAECGADLRVECGFSGERKEQSSASVAMVHSIPELIVSEEQAVEIGKEDEVRLIDSKKLVLLVDLDQTLLHTTNDNVPNNLKDVIHFQLYHGNRLMWYHTKFRPGTEKFLERISKMYELHICTFGARMYAHTMARHLDPDGKYFSHRILSRDECFNPMSKTANLRALFPCGDSMVCIIDDREDIWSYAPHLVHVKPYRFFKGTADINAPPGCDKTDDVSEEIHADDALHKTETETAKGNAEYAASGPEATDADTTVVAEPAESTATTSVETTSDATTTVDATTAAVDAAATAEVASSSTTSENENNNIDSVPSSGTKTDDSSQKSDTTKTNDLEKSTPDSSEEAMEVDSSETSLVTSSGQSLQISESETSATPIEENNDTEMEGADKTVDETVVEKNGSQKSEEGVVSQKSEEGVVEWSDPDDYLLYLEDILTRIHKAYYDFYDEHIAKKTPTIPDLKNIIPYVKRKVLKKVNLVFSGVVPKNIPQEQCKAWQLAKSLGANVQDEFVRKGENATTHVVAAKLGTAKVHQALRDKRVKLLTVDWLWCCAHRWEKVEESLFLLQESNSRSYGIDSPIPKAKRKHDDTDGELASTSEKRLKVSDARSLRDKFQDEISPMLKFSKEDLDSMDAELHDLIGSCSESESDSESESKNNSDSNSKAAKVLESKLRQKVLSGEDSESSSADSLSGDFPKGWKHQYKKRHSWPDPSKESSDSDGSDDENDTNRRLLITVGVNSDSSNLGSDVDSIGSVDEEMAEAVEREFLN